MQVAVIIIVALICLDNARAQCSFSKDECAVSGDIWLLGESCVMAGLKARYGEYVSAWSVDDRDLGESLAFILFGKPPVSSDHRFPYEGESLNVFKLLLLTQDKFSFKSTDRNLTLGHVFLSAELLSWSFYF